MKTIAVVDLTTGRTQERRRNTLTLDIPPDLDWTTGGISVDATLLGYYFATQGERLVYLTKPTVLSGRGVGAECLVADDLIASPGESFNRYRLSAVKRH